MTLEIRKYQGSASITGTEYSAPNAANYSSGSPIVADGIFTAMFDLVNLAAGDEFLFTVYDKVDGTNQRVIYQATKTGAQSQAFVMPPLPLGDGWDISLKKVNGTNRTIYWRITKVS